MHANVHTDRGGGGGGGGSWRLPPDETLQVGDPKAKTDEDSEYGGEGHNWRSIIFSLLVIGFVIAGIVTAIYLLGYVDELLYWSGRRMVLDEYLQGELIPKRLPPTWATKTKFVYQSDDGGLVLLDTANNTITSLVTNHTLRQLNAKDYKCTFDLKYVLFKHNVKQVFRKSTTAFYTVYDVTNDHHMPVQLKASPTVSKTRLQYANWIGHTTSMLIIVDNDIYIRQSPTDEEDVRLTFTGQPDIFYNGFSDWLYQEEIFTTPEAIWSSPDGTHLMYATFNDTNVGTLSYPWFESVTDGIIATVDIGSGNSFPDSRTIRYPTPGSVNPEVTLWVADITNLTDIQKWTLKPPIVFGQDYYLTSADWVSSNFASVVWMNRVHNLSIISTCFSPNWTCVEIHTERAPENEWLDIVPHPVFHPDGDSFLLLSSIQESDTEHFTHIKHITITQQRMAVITHGRYEQIAVIANGRYQVLRILAWDVVNHLVYYIGTQDRKPGQQHLYVVRDPVNADNIRSKPDCITCDLTEYLWRSRLFYDNCTYFDAFVSPVSSISSETGIDYYILECQGPGLPLSIVHQAKTHDMKRVLFNTRPTHTDKLNKLALPSQKSFEIPLLHGTRATVQLLFPPSWREELRDAAFPVMVEVNGRPGSIAVSDKFKIDWGTYMSSRNDVVYIRLDVRGSKGQSKKALYRHLGGVEVQDQITVLRYLLDMYKYLDKSRVAIWGWGYGGYVTAMVLGSQQNVFKCGIAVSPISDWLYYNSVFTEKILGLPLENVKGYVEADAAKRAEHIPSHSFYLMHGLADKSVPYLHGIKLAGALTKAGVLFQYQAYADEGHDLINQQEHVYQSMEYYMHNCLTLDSDETRIDAAKETVN